MANNREDKFHGNVPAWLRLADVQIDYFSQFVKAWLPFNAWFATKYSTENTDRDIISRIKKETNPFRDRIITHFRLSDKESKDFINLIGKLHFELEQHNIPSTGRRITFTNIVLEKNLQFKCDATTKGKRYKIMTEYKPNAPKGTQKVNVKVILLLGYVPKMDWDQNEWDIEELKTNPNFQAIATDKDRYEVQDAILNCYNAINPLKPINLILPAVRKSSKNPELAAPSNSIEIDAEKNLYFINDPTLIAKGVVEVTI